MSTNMASQPETSLERHRSGGGQTRRGSIRTLRDAPDSHRAGSAERGSAETVRLIHGSAEDLFALEDASVTLTVTSPPYWNAIDYDRHATDSRQWYRTRSYGEGFKEYEEYLAFLGRVFGGILSKTRPGGFCAIVIGTVLFRGRHYPVPFDLTARMVALGWEFHQDFIWHKVTGGVRRAGTFIQKPYPGYFYPNLMTEYVLVFRKPGPPIYSTPSSAEKRAAAVPIDRLFTMDMAHNIWHIAPVPPGHLDHPCPFPEEIPWRVIRLYSYPGDVVLDPFTGSGQTLKVARYLGRRAVGYETVHRYVEYTRRRIDEPAALREKQLIAVFEKIPLGASRTETLSPRQKRRGRGRSPEGEMPLFASSSGA